MRIIEERAQAVFIELPAFERHREEYLNEAHFRELQAALIANPLAGELIEGTGGLRKMRFADERRRKGKRGGLRIIYYWWSAGFQFWLFTIYDKDEISDLTPQQRKAFKAMMKAELRARSTR